MFLLYTILKELPSMEHLTIGNNEIQQDDSLKEAESL